MILELRRPLVFLDLETTGLDPETDRIVEIGLVKVHPDGRRESLCERVNPERDIPETAARVHGIRTEEVCGLFGKPRLKERIHDLVAFVGDSDLAGFNSIAFDTPLWIQECARCGVTFPMEGRHQIDVRNIFRVRFANLQAQLGSALTDPFDDAALTRAGVAVERDEFRCASPTDLT